MESNELFAAITPIECPSCNNVFIFAHVGIDESTEVECKKCNHIFFVLGNEYESKEID